ncbi:precorrin-6Y C5,15-methyltransferase (decarboxylating) [Thiohalospira halophila DSM 15071]|uniref:Precorrin-6Y C5,15-methyltransferase (Decarboxylating) n=1 Tax=Thiohalospira halophila DSM 15071 TaxID=1123397 RepID=A0A1I1Q4I6_9GAMM|nr:precorrin-6y C5,15-methyltransferase (decarboxylating) subunit CbiE [Thiohalospira halophila]SFD16935.1 precorrin-6Y C5,15-methyltransferase (decarboxylating) [Thiohalospira halophila DSM 15071]
MDSVNADGTPAPWLAVVGLGDDGPAGLAPRARSLVEEAGTVFGGERHLGLLPEQSGQERIPWPSPLTEALPWIEARRGRPVCVLASGDPFWYGIGATLARHLPAAEMEVVPAPSAFSLAAARLGWPLQETRCLSLHGRALERIHPWLQEGARLLVLSWDGTTPAALAQRLTERGFGGSRLTVLEHLGGTAEDRRTTRAADWSEPETAALNTVAVECRAEPGARIIPRSPGRPESAFHHDGNITKREVRAVALARLAPESGERLWDLGAGSGAVGVEWMLTDPANHAVAVEHRTDRLENIAANAREFGVPDLECIQGRAPDALAGLPDPDAIFIGGGLTSPGLLERCHAALPTGGRLVATSVTVEGDAALAAAADRYGGELSRLAVERAEPLGGFTGWAPLRPVTLWSLVAE